MHFIDPHAAHWDCSRVLEIPEYVTQRVLLVNDERMTRRFGRGEKKYSFARVLRGRRDLIFTICI